MEPQDWSPTNYHVKMWIKQWFHRLLVGGINLPFPVMVSDIVVPTELPYFMVYPRCQIYGILWLNPPPICDPKSHSYRWQCFRPADLVTQHVLGGLAVESWKKTLENSGRGLITEHLRTSLDPVSHSTYKLFLNVLQKNQKTGVYINNVFEKHVEIHMHRSLRHPT